MLVLQAARPQARQEPGLAPLTDVVFLLLAFFILAGQVQRPDPEPVLPPASASEARPAKGRVELLVDSQGALWLDGLRLAPGDLAAALEEQPTRPVLVKADADLPVETLRTALVELRRAGALEAALATRPRAAGEL